MDESIRDRLRKTSEELSIYAAAPPSGIEEVFNFKAAVDMDTTDSRTLSRFTVMLGQYLISLQVKYNTARVLASQKRKVLDRRVREVIHNKNIKGTSLKEKEANALASDVELQLLEADYDAAAAERDLLDGLDKPIIELINAIKSELRRRAEEKTITDRERSY